MVLDITKVFVNATHRNNLNKTLNPPLPVYFRQLYENKN